jgi:asparagine synthase (glutamine-hydrolysing)
LLNRGKSGSQRSGGDHHDRLQRLGKKPLYYWDSRDRLVFGSEIKAILADPAVPRRLDEAAIPAYLTFGYVPTPRTFFAGIRSLPPGHVLSLEESLATAAPT